MKTLKKVNIDEIASETWDLFHRIGKDISPQDAKLKIAVTYTTCYALRTKELSIGNTSDMFLLSSNEEENSSRKK